MRGGRLFRVSAAVAAGLHAYPDVYTCLYGGSALGQPCLAAAGCAAESECGVARAGNVAAPQAQGRAAALQAGVEVEQGVEGL